jgi:sigma-B regulation protein RsbU (phosphoserine phosphatase)
MQQTLTVDSDTLGSILNSVPVGVIVADMDGRFVFFNREAERILGTGVRNISPAEWAKEYGCYLPDRVTPYPADQSPLSRTIKGEVVTDHLIFIMNPQQPDGLWISVSGSPWQNGRNAVRGGVVILSDVTEHRDVERESRFKEQLLAALDQTADSVVITNKLGEIEYVNPAFEVMTGYGRNETLGKSPAILKSNVQDHKFYQNLWETITRGDSFHGILVNRRKDGQLFSTQQTITPMKDRNGDITHFVSVWKDITELLQQQEKEVEMRLARDIQRGFLGSPPSVRGLDLAGNSFPADETGGDYCDFIEMADGCLGLVIGDVSGHGISAALITAEIRAYLRAFAVLNTDPGIILTMLNRALAPDLHRGRFVTILLVCLDKHRRSLSYANAGHPAGVVLDAAGSLQYSLESAGPPLGVVADFEYSNCRESLSAEDQVLVLFTDGIADALASEDMDLGIQLAIEFVAEHAGNTARNISEGLCQVALLQANNQSYKDDVTTIVVKINWGSGSARNSL